MTDWNVLVTSALVPAMSSELTNRPGHTHSPWTVGGPALWAGINFPGVSNLTSAYLFDTLVTGMGQSDELKFKDVTTKILLGECM